MPDWRAIRADYEAGVIAIADLTRKHRVGYETLYRRGAQDGWTWRDPRKRGSKGDRIGVTSLPRKQRLMYRKLRENGIDRAEAYRQALI